MYNTKHTSKATRAHLNLHDLEVTYQVNGQCGK